MAANLIQIGGYFYMKIGLIQTKGIGDIIIALPIADFFYRKGHQVIWPIDAKFYDSFKAVAPHIEFIPVTATEIADYFFKTPLSLLKKQSCDAIYCLYSTLGFMPITNPGFAASLKFDEYKYAIAGVPFNEKWNLKIQRNMDREKSLYDSLKIHKQYICIHKTGSGMATANITIPEAWSDFQIVEIGPRTDSMFDWIFTLERAAKLLLIDSCFSNLVEQLNLPNEKYFLLRSPVNFTPVLKNQWRFLNAIP